MKIDNLSEEELAEFLEENSRLDQRADGDNNGEDENIDNDTVVKETIDVMPPKEQRKKDNGTNTE